MQGETKKRFIELANPYIAASQHLNRPFWRQVRLTAWQGSPERILWHSSAVSQRGKLPVRAAVLKSTGGATSEKLGNKQRCGLSGRQPGILSSDTFAQRTTDPEAQPSHPALSL